MEKRYISIGDKPTTLVLESYYWRLLQVAAKKQEISWQDLCRKLLRNKPPSYNSRAGYLRLYCTSQAYTELEKTLGRLLAASTASP